MAIQKLRIVMEKISAVIYDDSLMHIACDALISGEDFYKTIVTSDRPEDWTRGLTDIVRWAGHMDAKKIQEDNLNVLPADTGNHKTDGAGGGD